MKNKRLYLPLIMLVGLFLGIGCGDQNKEVPSNEVQDEALRMEKPGNLGMNQDSLEANVREFEIDLNEQLKADLVEEAVISLAKVEDAVIALANNDKESALASLENATGKLEILLAREPDLAFVPIDVSIRTVDLVADLETIKQVKKQIKKAIKDNHFQIVREEAANLASELQITTVEMPLATFPPAMSLAATHIENDDLEAAKEVLYIVLNTLVVSEERIPLPILRAQALIDQAQNVDATEEQKENVLLLLDNAEYQLIMAEELGYGDRDKEYEDLNQKIKELKKSVKDKSDSQSLFNSLKLKLSKFKERITS